ncbi:reverse transcriptase domain-containing protein [Tanacetum coccineum]
MEDDFKPAVQHQRRVNLKIHEFIKKEVIKLFDAGLIYPIFDSPWVSPVHCVPKKGGMTVVENEDNELIPTRLVMGWRVCIDHHKLNDATRKDHFPLPFMYQMLERLTKRRPPSLALMGRLPTIICFSVYVMLRARSNIKGIDPSFCTHKILMEDDFKPAVQHQRRVNLKIHEFIKKKVIKLLDAGLIYPIFDSLWVSPVHCVPKKGGMTVVENKDNELIPTRLVMGWRVCIDHRKLNDATRKDHFPLPFMYQMLERLAGNEYYCFLDGFSVYFQIPIDPQDQEKTTFTCPYGTFAYRHMPFGLCNAQDTFQRCMMAIFHDMIEETMEVFMDDFSVFGDSFSSCLSHLDKMLKRCEDTNLVLN